ncbi:hypothetical protein [Escherichia coli]|uniref:hypothetical protein n=1 Tax=Escherichia coli TaxID=562 RepID=UPI00285F94E5|nr:hypothetical protein [Escherichia coli]MDR7991212.1 hypothetical protein [Escherichia coli]
MRLLLKGLVGMALAWLVIGFGMELFFLADRVHPALRVIVVLGMLFLLIMIAGGMWPFSSVTKENIMTILFTPLHLWRRMMPVL